MTQPNEHLIAVTLSRLPESAIEELEQYIATMDVEDGLDSDVLRKFQMLIIGYDAAWDEAERLLEENKRLNKEVKDLESCGEDYEEKLTKLNNQVCDLQDALAEEDEIPKLRLELQQSREENTILQQKLKDYEGCKGVEDYYSVLCALRDTRVELEGLRKELDSREK